MSRRRGLDTFDLVATNELTNTTTVARHPSVVDAAIDDEVVLLQCDSAIYYSLSASGSRLWELVSAPRSLDELIGGLASHYEIEPSVCDDDVRTWVADMLDAQLVVVS